MTTIEGYAPVTGMRDYQMEVNSYTRGQGHLTCTFRGYEPCRNAEAVIEEIGYDPERDIENPTGSVFCSHGAGFNVPWNQVPEYMHLENQLEKEQALEEAKRQSEQAALEKEYHLAGLAFWRYGFEKKGIFEEIGKEAKEAEKYTLPGRVRQ